MLTYPLEQIPFSLPGSFLTITSRNTTGSRRLLYKTCSSRAVTAKGQPFNSPDFFEISLIRDGRQVPYEWTAWPHRLDLLASGDGSATFTFGDPETLLFETRGVGLGLLPLKPFAAAFAPSVDQFHLVDHPARGVHKLWARPGTTLTPFRAHTLTGLDHIHQDVPYAVEFHGAEGAEGALRFTPHEGIWNEPLPEIDDVLSQRERQYEDWLARIPLVPPEYQDAAEQAWFLLWNCQAPAGGALTRPAVFMSKFWMNAIWAWDNCFNALAIAGADAKLAWDQLLLFFDHQNEEGMVPDMINDLEPIYGFTKPPIHGWTIRKLVEKTGLKESLPYLKELYKPVSRLTEWWYTHRDFDGDGMPQYHHGNDSGWDNATLFDQGYPTEGADLAAHLVLQCEALAFMAEILDKPKAPWRWQERAREQLNALLKQGVRDNHFFSPLNGKRDAPPTRSLLNYIPIELGYRLAGSLFDSLVADLAPGGPFLTNYGLASESPQSAKYQPDGYWRGPIWAPSTYLIFDGLVNAGKTDLATTIAERFCSMCVQEPGFWENYDALTGKGLRCPGYSWTAAVFLLLAEWLGKE